MPYYGSDPFGGFGEDLGKALAAYFAYLATRIQQPREQVAKAYEQAQLTGSPVELQRVLQQTQPQALEYMKKTQGVDLAQYLPQQLLQMPQGGVMNVPVSPMTQLPLQPQGPLVPQPTPEIPLPTTREGQLVRQAFEEQKQPELMKLWETLRYMSNQPTEVKKQIWETRRREGALPKGWPEKYPEKLAEEEVPKLTPYQFMQLFPGKTLADYSRYAKGEWIPENPPMGDTEGPSLLDWQRFFAMKPKATREEMQTFYDWFKTKKGPFPFTPEQLPGLAGEGTGAAKWSTAWVNLGSKLYEVMTPEERTQMGLPDVIEALMSGDPTRLKPLEPVIARRAAHDQLVTTITNFARLVSMTPDKKEKEKLLEQFAQLAGLPIDKKNKWWQQWMEGLLNFLSRLVGAETTQQQPQQPQPGSLDETLRKLTEKYD